MNSKVLLILLLLFSWSCKNNKEVRKCSQENAESTCGVVPGKINIRFYNNTKFQICNLMYQPVKTNQGYYTSIESYNKTCYLPYDSSYRYGLIMYDIDGNKGFQTPIDFVGETLLEPGNYTMELIDLQNASSNKIGIGKLQKD